MKNDYNLENLYDMPRHLKFILSALFLVISVPFVMAYDSDNLVESAFESGAVARGNFMVHFQDGNVIAACIGIVCVILFAIFRRKVSQRLHIGWITFAFTLIAFSLIMMILGIGSIVAVSLAIYFQGIVLVIMLVAVLLLLLIHLIVSVVDSEKLKKSWGKVWNNFKKSVVVVPLSFIVASILYMIVISQTETWNLNKCEKYVQSRYKGFDDVAPLMLQWEKDHWLQWGNTEEDAEE